jgi:hypothetical protein
MVQNTDFELNKKIFKNTKHWTDCHTGFIIQDGILPLYREKILGGH